MENRLKLLILNNQKELFLLKKKNKDRKFRLIYGPINNVIIEKNKLKNSGKTINPNGISILKLSSKVNELLIQ